MKGSLGSEEILCKVIKRNDTPHNRLFEEKNLSSFDPSLVKDPCFVFESSSDIKVGFNQNVEKKVLEGNPGVHRMKIYRALNQQEPASPKDKALRVGRSELTRQINPRILATTCLYLQYITQNEIYNSTATKQNDLSHTSYCNLMQLDPSFAVYQRYFQFAKQAFTQAADLALRLNIAKLNRSTLILSG
ncbi:hypothetical protein TNCT_6861 [Trichonephila clavata]|uniref:Uncharacterized protein n=1 Tax=Trichonephila clavata TaxID=2740835 RepID=A0A8X6L7W6_TRICU|nr:hypothetical protein TNCT_6861 [Trichonephila clavata]